LLIKSKIYKITLKSGKRRFFEMIHGMKGSRFYEIWRNMKKRCFNLNRKDYKNYGGRGITVCEEWLTFKNFMNDMYGSYQAHVKKFGENNTTLDRKDANGNYEPSNCKWSTRIEQNNNKNPIAKQHGYRGEKLTLKEFAKKYGINYATLRGRVYRGLSVKDAIEIPNNGRGGDRRSREFKPSKVKDGE
jgi:hypothetical protein